MSLQIIIALAGALLLGVIAGYTLRFLIALSKKGSMELEIKETLLSAKRDAEKIIADAEKEATETLKQVRQEIKEQEEKLRKTEDRLVNKEGLLDKRQTSLDEEENKVKKQIEEFGIREQKLNELEKEKVEVLQSVAKISPEEAKKMLFESVEKQNEEDLIVRLRKLEITGQEQIDKKAKDLLLTAIQRYGNSVSNDVFSTVVSIQSDELKGKIIGKEGRNIKTFERVTGVDVLIDDTPGAVVISSFDPIRRQIARLTLEYLIEDGRIQPAKIEQMAEKASKEVQKIMKEKGEQAAFECGIFNLDPKLMMILGRLYFRTSYGQNVLQHSVEMAHIAGMIAEELGADIQIAKAGALLHDIGKAVDHEVAGSHVEIGRRILQKFNVDEKIIKAMQAHHEEYPFETVESVIVQVADAISGSRPGARRDSVENYLKRLEELEGLANGFKGVEKAYALQAGREIRVFVKSEELSDLEAHNLARDLALKIEQELKYPGEIKVTVIRETRVIDFAR